jgi:hypothetical protein
MFHPSPSLTAEEKTHLQVRKTPICVQKNRYISHLWYFVKPTDSGKSERQNTAGSGTAAEFGSIGFRLFISHE